MKAWLEGLEARERLILLVGSVFTFAALVYMLVWEPLNTRSEQLREDLISTNETIEELIRFEGRIAPPTAGNTGASGNRALVLLISQTVTQFSLNDALQSSKPSGNDSTVTVRFENAGFDSLVAWLEELRNSHGLDIRSASFRQSGLSGRVNSTLTLER